MTLLDSLQVWTSFTANWAVTNESSLNACIDLFFIAWASRTMEETAIQKLFSLAYNEDKNLAMKILFWARDIRLGAWERRFFRVCLDYIKDNHKEDISKIAQFVPEFGRWDDLFWIINNDSALSLFTTAIKNGDGLASKWSPRKWDIAKLFIKTLKLTPKQYRKLIVSNTKVVETQMCNKEWDKIEYSKVPSCALNQYIKAWNRNDETRFNQYLESVKKWDEKMNASVLFPYQVYENYKKWEKALVEAQWDNLAQYTWSGSILPVIDVSWSMSWLPISISVSLGVYLAEHIKWPFQDCFISFEWRPKLHKLQGNILDRFLQCERSADDMSTNLIWVFELILSVAVRDKLKQEEMPEKIVIISDMEFNNCGNGTNYQTIKNFYEQYGYKVPYLIFWNVNGREGNVPITNNDFGWMISGASPSIINWIMSWELTSPYSLMMATIGKERYSKINL